MSHGFDKALVTRERNRELLAEVLDEKYQAEARTRNFKRMMILAISVAMSIYVARGGINTFRRLKAIKPVARDAALEQMRKQILQSDQMMIGANNAEPPPLPRSKGERNSFDQEKIPLDLYGELAKKPKSGKKQEREYGPPGEKQAADLEKIQQKAERKPKVDCSQYRPIAISDMPKLPPVISRKLASSAGLYVQVKTVSPRLAADARAFP